MYKLVFINDREGTYTALHSGSLMECLSKRTMSGDAILIPKGTVLRGTVWLFDWEKLDPNCYIRKLQARQPVLGGAAS